MSAVASAPEDPHVDAADIIAGSDSSHDAVLVSPQVFSYFPPTVREINEGHPAATGAVVTIVGTNFGMSNSAPQALVAGSVCEETEWISNEEMTCKVPLGVGKDRPVVVAVAAAATAINVAVEGLAVVAVVAVLVVFECHGDVVV